MSWRKRVLTNIGLRLRRLGDALVDEPQPSAAPPAHWLELLAKSEVPIQWQSSTQIESEMLPYAAPPQPLDLGISDTPQNMPPTYLSAPTSDVPSPPVYPKQANQLLSRPSYQLPRIRPTTKPPVFEPIAHESNQREIDYANGVHSDAPPSDLAYQSPVRLQTASVEFSHLEEERKPEKTQSDVKREATQPIQPTYQARGERPASTRPTYLDKPSKLAVLLSYLPWREKRGETSAEFPPQRPSTKPKIINFTTIPRRNAAELEISQTVTGQSKPPRYARHAASAKPQVEWQSAEPSKQKPLPTYPTIQPNKTKADSQFTPSADHWPTLPTHPLLDDELWNESHF